MPNKKIGSPSVFMDNMKFVLFFQRLWLKLRNKQIFHNLLWP